MERPSAPNNRRVRTTTTARGQLSSVHGDVEAQREIFGALQAKAEALREHTDEERRRQREKGEQMTSRVTTMIIGNATFRAFRAWAVYLEVWIGISASAQVLKEYRTSSGGTTRWQARQDLVSLQLSANHEPEIEKLLAPSPPPTLEIAREKLVLAEAHDTRRCTRHFRRCFNALKQHAVDEARSRRVISRVAQRWNNALAYKVGPLCL